MAVKLRMTRIGRRHRPFFRINAVESRTPRDGKVIEKLGHYDPIEKDPAKQIMLDRERTEYWLEHGAIPSDTVSQILLRLGIKHKYAEQKAARREKARDLARAKGKLFTKADRIAAQKKAEQAEEEAKAKAKAEEEAAKAQAKAEEEKAKAQAEAKSEAQAKPEEKEQAAPKAEVTEEKTDAKTEAAPKKLEAEVVEEKAEADFEPAKAEAEPEEAETEAETVKEKAEEDTKEESASR
jgi:small subunit ribosomal protein S16